MVKILSHPKNFRYVLGGDYGESIGFKRKDLVTELHNIGLEFSSGEDQIMTRHYDSGCTL